MKERPMTPKDLEEYWDRNDEHRQEMLTELIDVCHKHMMRTFEQITQAADKKKEGLDIMIKMWQDAVAIGYYYRVREENQHKGGQKK